MEKKIAQKAPYVKEMKAGKYAWCACGLSSNQPLCDGSHKDTGMHPVIVDLAKDQTVAFCGCKHSKNGAYCDGSHNSL